MSPLIDIGTQWVPLSADIDERSESEAGDGTLLQTSVSCRRTSERSPLRRETAESCAAGTARVLWRSSRAVAMTSIQTAQRLCTAGPDLTEAE